MKKQKGITLIALIITIIILLILAGVVLNLTIGQNGIINRAKEAGKTYQNAAENELAELDLLYRYLNGEEKLPDNTPQTDAGTIVALPDKWKTTTPSYVSTTDGIEVVSSKTVASVYAVSDGTGETVPVPIGFYYVGGTLESGVVISDNSVDKNKYAGQTDVPSGIELNEDGATISYELVGNLFVWVPCTESEYKKTNVWNGTTQTNTTLANAWWDTTVDQAGVLQTEKYGGFYVARYEAGLDSNIAEFDSSQKNTGSNQIYNIAGTPQSKAGVSPWIFVDWTTSKNNAKNMYNTDYVESGLITGTQWDVMINWMTESDSELTNSGSWGNHVTSMPIITLGRTAYAYASSGYWYINSFDSTWITDIEKPLGSNTSSSQKAYLWTTGASEQAKKKNLYDVAGNIWECTEEVSFSGGNVSAQYREYRGGGYGNESSTSPVCYRYGGSTVSRTSFDIGFRVVLYIK